jgi:hypothetical protein
MGRPSKVSNNPTLSDQGITRDQSSRWQRVAAVPEAVFEAHVEKVVGTLGADLPQAGGEPLSQSRPVLRAHCSTSGQFQMAPRLSCATG